MSKTNDKVIFSLIAAHTTNRVIGKGNKLPWSVPSDLQRFKSLTTGRVVVMGRKTYDSIGKPLKNRINIVITSDEKFDDKIVYSKPELIGINSVVGAIQLATKMTEFLKVDDANEIMVIGGEKIYNAFLPIATKMYLTELGFTLEDGNALFPEFNPLEWVEQHKSTHVEPLGLIENIKQHIEIPYTYRVLARKQG